METKLTKEDLDLILANHKLWRKTSGKSGVRANFRNTDLSGLDLSGAELCGCEFQLAHLREANLRGANLAGANLTGADLVGANLRDANLYGAKLVGADLTNAYIAGADFTETNLSRCKGIEFVQVACAGVDGGASITFVKSNGSTILCQAGDAISEPEFTHTISGSDTHRLAEIVRRVSEIVKDLA